MGESPMSREEGMGLRVASLLLVCGAVAAVGHVEIVLLDYGADIGESLQAVPAKKAPVVPRTPYKQWGNEAKAFPDEYLKSPGSNTVPKIPGEATAKTIQVTRQDEKKYGTGAKGDEKEMKVTR